MIKCLYHDDQELNNNSQEALKVILDFNEEIEARETNECISEDGS